MRYLSTRGGMEPAPFRDVLLEGLAVDGGLIVPEYYPQIDEARLAGWRGLDYPGLASEILALYCDDLPRAELDRIVRATYTPEVFDAREIVPLRELGGGLHLLGLSQGPTLAFKDVAMQLLGGLFEWVLAQNGRSLNVLGATSGDTGSAAEYALRGRRGMRVFMLSPQGRMSPFQRAQMYSLQDANIFNIAVDGVFDDCQDLVKKIAGDLEFKRRYAIGTVNSINWGRVVAQVVYYFWGYFRATDTLAAGATPPRASFCVPSGNFGNVLAGWIARQMGLPIHQLVVATNENDVLDEFFRTGRYRARAAAETHATSSPSMDISKASNFERYIFDLVGRNPGAVRELWWELDTRGEFNLSRTPFWPKVQADDFASGRSAHADRLATIREVYQARGMIIDPHTADGIFVARRHVSPGVPMICMETALPAKFAETIVEAIGIEPPRPPALADLERRPQRFETLAVDAAALKDLIARHVAQAAVGGPAGDAAKTPE